MSVITEPPKLEVINNNEALEPEIIWGLPGAIENTLLPVKELPPDLIPAPLKPWVMDIAYRMQVPPDFSAVTAITILASVTGTACTIRPKQKDDWLVIPNLWGAIIGRPSVVLKTPSMKEPINMLVRLQKEAKDQYEDEKRKHQFNLKVQEQEEKRLDKLIKEATENKDSEALDILRDEYCQETEVQELVCRIYKTNETSVQSQTELQTQNPRGILTYRDELIGLLAGWDRQGREDERAYFLEGWNGDGSYTDYKIGRGLTDAKNICISLLGGIQPDKLLGYLNQSMDGGNDGLVQRLQMAVYPDEPKDWRLVDEHPNQIEKDRVFNIFRTLADADFTEHGAIKTEHDKFPYMRFSDEAQAIFNEWLTELQHKLQNEDNPLVTEHLSKYRSLMPSLALIFHLLEMIDTNGNSPVSIQATSKAAGWCEYLESHARRIYYYAATPEREAARIISERINKLPNPFTAKDVYDKGWHLLKNRKQVEAACDVLIDENWLHMKAPESKRGRPMLPQYFINPALMNEN